MTSLRRPAAILVDLDNTLYDFDSAYRQATHHLAQELARHGVETESVVARHLQLRDSALPAGARSGREVRLTRMRQLQESFPPTRGLDPEALVDLLEGRLLQEVRLFPGALAALVALRGQAPLLVVTEGWADVQHAIMRALGLSPEDWGTFPTLSRGVTKADGSAYALALQQLQAPAEGSIMVGDNWHWDVLAPARLGIRQVWISHRRTAPTPPPQQFLGAVPEIGELTAWLERQPSLQGAE